MATKFAGYKMAAFLDKASAHIAYKNKAGINFQVIDTTFKDDVVGSGFSFYMGGTFTTVILEKNKKDGFYLEVAQPAYTDKIKLKLVDKKAFCEFLSSDYHDYKF
jgi:hypothetical protein